MDVVQEHLVEGKMKVCVIGPSKRFLSGITYFTFGLSNAFSKSHKVSVLFLRKLLPQFLFPGNKRVGTNISKVKLSNGINSYEGIDWYWFPSIFKALSFLRKEDPDAIIFQWWSGTVAHTYSLLKIWNKLFLKKKLVMEFHEVLDTAEAKIPVVRTYIKLMSRLLFKNFDAYVCHSKSDSKLISKKYNLKNVFVVPHGSYSNFKEKSKIKKDPKVCNILFFGLIREYKGLNYLIEAFNKIPSSKIKNYHLWIVGEAWEGCSPKELINKSKYKGNITLVERYVSDKEVNKYFSTADVLVLPYLRASQSGAAHIATSYGLPVITSSVGGLKESMKDYEGTIFVKPKDSEAIKKEILKIYPKRKKRYKNIHSWDETIKQFEKILEK